MPTKSAMTVNTGAMMMPASMRGTTSFRMGSVPRARKRVDLVGDDHRTELGRDAGPDAAAQHQAGQHRAQLLDHRGADQPADDRPRAELIQRQAALERQHRAGEEPGQEHDRQRLHANRVELLDDVVAVHRPRERRA